MTDTANALNRPLIPADVMERVAGLVEVIARVAASPEMRALQEAVRRMEGLR